MLLCCSSAFSKTSSHQTRITDSDWAPLSTNIISAAFRTLCHTRLVVTISHNLPLLQTFRIHNVFWLPRCVWEAAFGRLQMTFLEEPDESLLRWWWMTGSRISGRWLGAGKFRKWLTQQDISQNIRQRCMLLYVLCSQPMVCGLQSLFVQNVKFSIV